jgi:TonB family protein
VNVHFLVDEKGNISNVTTVGNKVGYGLDEEAVRVVSKMPKWNPGQVKGKNVKTWRTLPIMYRLEES